MMQKIDDHAGDVLWCQLPALFVRGRVAAKFGVDGAGHDVTDLDIVMTHFLHQRFAKTIEPKFGGIVGGHARMRIRAGQGRDVDDVTAAALFHLRNGFVTTVEDTEQIGFQHRAKIFRRSLSHGFKRADAGIVDKNIEAAKFLNGVVDKSFDLIVVADVANKTSCVTAQIADCPIDFVLLSGSDADGDAFTGERPGNGATDAFRTARDDCDFVGEIHDAQSRERGQYRER